jgi:hypothetical protein
MDSAGQPDRGENRQTRKIQDTQRGNQTSESGGLAMGARGRPCSVCIGDASVLQQIDGLIGAGEMPTAISRITGIPKDRIVRHRKHELAPAPPANPAESGNEMAASDERLDRWLLRSEELYQASVSQADLKSAIQAVQHGVRSEIEWRRRTEARTEEAVSAKGNSEKDGAPSVEWLDRIVRRVREAKAERGSNIQW